MGCLRFLKECVEILTKLFRKKNKDKLLILGNLKIDGKLRFYINNILKLVFGRF